MLDLRPVNHRPVECDWTVHSSTFNTFFVFGWWFAFKEKISWQERVGKAIDTRHLKRVNSYQLLNFPRELFSSVDAFLEFTCGLKNANKMQEFFVCSSLSYVNWCINNSAYLMSVEFSARLSTLKPATSDHYTILCVWLSSLAWPSWKCVRGLELTKKKKQPSEAKNPPKNWWTPRLSHCRIDFCVCSDKKATTATNIKVYIGN